MYTSDSIIITADTQEADATTSEDTVQVNTKPHKHYFKDVKNLEYIDVYRVIKLFDVTDPCLQHAVKKLLCTGKRGHKDINRDVNDVIDSCNRFLEMSTEDGAL